MRPFLPRGAAVLGRGGEQPRLVLPQEAAPQAGGVQGAAEVGGGGCRADLTAILRGEPAASGNGFTGRDPYGGLHAKTEGHGGEPPLWAAREDLCLSVSDICSHYRCDAVCQHHARPQRRGGKGEFNLSFHQPVITLFKYYSQIQFKVILPRKSKLISGSPDLVS